VSFDLYFLKPAPGETWQDAMDALEEHADDDEPLTEDHVALWTQLEQRARALLGDVEVFGTERHRELNHDSTGLQLSMSRSELSLTVPYWYDGPQALELHESLRQLAEAVEQVTGRTAYDPQGDRPFLEGGPDDTAETFQRVRDFVDDGRVAGQAGAGEVEHEQPRRRRWFGRRP
jgi:hypothetical protein